jgi:DNA-binding MurR/RpiR family transcriptional regulator
MLPAETPLRRLLDHGAGAFSKNQRVLAKHILANYQSVAFSTVKELAGAAGVSEATVVRFAKALRFKGYPDFQREIRRIVRADMKGTERFQHTLGTGTPDNGPLAAIIEKESENIASLRDTLDRRAFARAIAAIRKARDILVIGARSAAPLAQYLWFGLDKLDLPATCAQSITSETYDRLNRMPRGACVVVIGFPRYLRELVPVLDFARRRMLKTITITDSPYSALRGDITLHCPAVSASFVASLSAPLILLNGLLHHLSLADKARTLNALNRFEALAESRSYFLKS